MPQELAHLDQPVLPYARRDFAELREDFTIQQALEAIRRQGVGEKVVYFYVVDEQEHLLGVLPTRRLLTAGPEQALGEVMIRQVVALPAGASILDACELFVVHRFLALPVIDEERRMLGVIDVNLFTEEVLDIGEKERTDEVFEALGFRISQVRAARPWRAFRLRFPWLLATISSGTLCALVASAYSQTIARSLVLAFFMTLVLALGEGVGIQSMALSVQALRGTRPTFKWFAAAFRQEGTTALLLGAACGLAVAGLISLWHGYGLAALVIGASVMLSLFAACLFGLTVPALLHWLRLDPKIAAGPVTLALTDICTLLCYLGLARLLL
jgi:magnesium transporter